MDPQDVDWGFVVALFATLAAVIIVTPLCERLGFVDAPTARKAHGAVVPYSGGLALGLVLLPLLGLYAEASPPWPALAGLFLCWLLGLVDDARPLPSVLKFAAQLVAGGAIAQALAPEIRTIGIALLPAGTSEIAVFGLAIFCAVGLMNALNMIDGSDGLAGSQVLAVLAGLALFTGQGAGASPALPLLVAGAVAGYLVFNFPYRWRPFRIFMGDGGALLLAGLVAIVVIQHAAGAPGTGLQSAAPWALVFLLCDTMAVIFARVSVGRYPFSPDRWHLHHLLLDAGWSMGRVAGFAALVAVVGAAFGAGLDAAGLSSAESFLLLLMVVTVYATLMALKLRRRHGTTGLGDSREARR